MRCLGNANSSNFDLLMELLIDESILQGIIMPNMDPDGHWMENSQSVQARQSIIGIDTGTYS